MFSYKAAALCLCLCVVSGLGLARAEDLTAFNRGLLQAGGYGGYKPPTYGGYYPPSGGLAPVYSPPTAPPASPDAGSAAPGTRDFNFNATNGTTATRSVSSNGSFSLSASNSMWWTMTIAMLGFIFATRH